MVKDPFAENRETGYTFYFTPYKENYLCSAVRFVGRKQRGWSSSPASALLSKISELPGMDKSNNSDIMQLPFQ